MFNKEEGGFIYIGKTSVDLRGQLARIERRR
jgi:hypothetical protein